MYPLAEYDSVVGLTLNVPLGIEQYDVDPWEATQIQVFDLTGRRVGDSLEHLAPGVYVIGRLEGQAVITKKILVR